MFYLKDGVNIYPDYFKDIYLNDNLQATLSEEELKDPIKALEYLLEKEESIKIYLPYKDFVAIRLNSFSYYLNDISDDLYWCLYHVIHFYTYFLQFCYGEPFTEELMKREEVLSLIDRTPRNVLIDKPFEFTLVDYLKTGNEEELVEYIVGIREFVFLEDVRSILFEVDYTNKINEKEIELISGVLDNTFEFTPENIKQVISIVSRLSVETGGDKEGEKEYWSVYTSQDFSDIPSFLEYCRNPKPVERSWLAISAPVMGINQHLVNLLLTNPFYLKLF
uniref:Uncharacterized protein n=1 Tax=Myoviridae sp. ctijX18 TaxID=2825154 RepID=A0A8S5USS0_9CAUD|nr:MAG TPA: hypothetical protein [Myoviridae sp. ctijX18]DAJ69065.1 MAG TPA: hypothetical protein [Caudoviricetes sp.]